MTCTKLFLIGLLVASTSIMKEKGDNDDEIVREEEEVARVLEVAGGTL